MATQGYTDNYSSTLSSGYTSGGTSLSVTSASGLPTSGLEFYLLVAAEGANTSELFKVTSYSGTTLTVVGAQGNTAASNHASGAAISGCYVATPVLDGIRADQSKIGTFASLPASGMKKGDRYRCTDAPYEFVYDGTNFIPFHPAHGKVVLPVASNFSWVNQGAATETTSHGYTYLFQGQTTAFSMSARVMAQPSKPYTIIALVRPVLTNLSFNAFGLCWRDSASGKFHCWGPATESGVGVDSFKADSATSFNSQYSGSQFAVYGAAYQEIWLRIQDDNTSRICSYSVNGQDWIVTTTIGNTDFLTANQIGYWCKSQNSTVGAGGMLISWEQS